MANNTGIKHGGRKKGTPNRVTKEMRVVLKNLIHSELENLPSILKDLPIKDRLEILIKLIPFVLPKVKETSHTINEPIDWDF